MPDWFPWIVIPVAALAVNVACFVLYAADKSAARAGRRRVPERTLLAVGIAGGWPGAVAAQVLLRHKTRKKRFRSAFRLSVGLNIVAVVGLIAVAATLAPTAA